MMPFEGAGGGAAGDEYTAFAVYTPFGESQGEGGSLDIPGAVSRWLKYRHWSPSKTNGHESITQCQAVV